jgi:SPP1 gp7 family putative phage head morphogenesis protein
LWYPLNGSDHIKFEAGAVVHFKDYDPANPLRGLGDTEVIMRDLVLQHGAQRYLEAMMRHSGDPGGYIMVEDEMTPGNERRAEADAAEKFGPDHKGRWRVISGKNVKYEPSKFGPRDMEFKELLLSIVQVTSSAFGVPMPVLGILDDATYSNFATAVEQFWRNGNGVLAYLASVEDTINSEFLGRLRGTRERTFIARFDTSHVEALKDDAANKLELAKAIAEANIGVSFNEATAIVGLTGVETEFGGVVWVPPNITTASEAIANAEKNEKDGRPEPAALNGQPAPGSNVTGEEDDFPGSDGGESGSNGPTGSDGKQVGRLEQRGDDVTAHQTSDGPPDYSTREGRIQYFKEWEAGVLRPGEIRVRKVVGTWLGSYASAQIKKVEDFARLGDPGVGEGKANEISPLNVLQDEELLNILLLAHQEWVDKLAGKVKIPLSDVMKAASDDIAAELSADPISPGGDPWAVDYLRSQRIKLAEGVNSTLARDVHAALVKVFRTAPFDMATLQEHVRRLLPELQGALRKVFASRTARAAAIARTEVNRAANGTRYETFRRENIEEHQWVTSGDDEVRNRAPHSHRVLDGVVAKVGDSFREGFTLRFPLDPDGDPGDVINCRCVTRPIVKD